MSGQAQPAQTTHLFEQTGIEIEFIPRTDTKEVELNRLSSAVQANTSPYIVFEDELTTMAYLSKQILSMSRLNRLKNNSRSSLDQNIGMKCKKPIHKKRKREP
jgi:hypothetical protein